MVVIQRIVCLAAELPEIFFHLGALDRIVGISAYTTRPTEALLIPKVSGFQKGSVSRIMACNPDLVMLTSGVQRDLANALAEQGATLLHLNPHRLEDMFSTIELIGILVDERQKAKLWIQELRMEVDKVREQASRLPWRPSVYFEEWMNPLYCGTGWISDLIEIAGGDDVFQDRSRQGRNVADRTVTVQDVVKAAPQIVLASWCGKPFDRSSFTTRFGDSTLPAITTGSIFALEATILQCGPMLIDALHTLFTIISQYVGNHEPK